MSNKIPIFIGDIHSQHRKLQDALEWVKSEFSSESTQLIFLGDCWDSRLDNYEKNYPPYSDPLQTYILIKKCVESHSSILLQSNHQDKLRRWLRWDLEGKKPNPVVPKEGLQYTISQFVDHLTIEEKVDLFEWLSALPYHSIINCYDSQHQQLMTFLCSHAYFNIETNVEQPCEKHKDQALYGLLTRDKKRVRWWQDDSPISFYGQSAIRIVGHHHEVFKGKYQRVVDGGCGSTGGVLTIHIPEFDLWQDF